MAHDPLSPSEALRTRLGTAAATVALLTFVYSVLILGQILLGLIVAFGLTFGAYLSYRTFAVLDSVADAAQRFAAVREREAERGSRFGRATDRDESAGDGLGDREASSPDRLTDRDR
ncbi:hypothetical protein DJ82_10065 [Halorubrum sp. Ib24]|uniref:hypothetical protein n=1 Tax=unclassified Halorubrum TaxID=2642239 RepID=UPI000B9966DA|nr:MULTISPECIES: hypothetical protein [unclassified Halorubrum]OYR39279.1 hypothetical protein DJ82_10065 [Halorubrum sp. Ib24]OYR43257.1 hypothetical protein DJ81_09600 [Halorubrum sp. Hd13]OYR48858.1 hypothetical protein DJ74_09675 [Halorubrum sp. Ea8]OYR50717.1 hypothetical protein DJ73_15610 [Halorubrum sp. Ea1]